MIGIDTNIFLRLILKDDLKQTEITHKFFKRFCKKDNSVFINNIVLAESFWVLRNSYKFSREVVVRIITDLVGTKIFVFEDINVVKAALYFYEKTNIDFADVLIGKINTSHGCVKTITFDQKAAKSLGDFSLLK